MKRALIILFTGMVVLSCAKPPGSGGEAQDPVDRAQMQIDQGQYDEAIKTLENVLKYEPTNDRARVVLASVYVHRAGLRIKQYFELEKIFRNGGDLDRSRVNLSFFDKIKPSKNSDWQKVYEFLRGLNETAQFSEQVSERLNQIPSLSPEQAQDIHQALLILTDIKTPSQGMFLYRGTIKTVYFKYLWINERFFQIGDNKLCTQKLGQLSQRLTLLRDYTDRMIVDLAIGLPKSRESLLKTNENFKKNINQAQFFILGAGEKTDIVSVVLKRSLKSSFVDGFTCDF